MKDQQSLPLAANYFYHRLPNGIEMIGQYMPSLSSITFGFQLDAAVINEPEEKLGLAHLFEYMLFQGTQLKDARALNEAFESLGARKGASAGLETAQLWAQIVNTKFDATLELMHEILLMPTFPKNELEQMRSVVLQEIRRRDDEPMSRIFDLARANFYRGTAFGRRRLGTTESVSGLQQQDLLDFWTARYQPNNVIFAIEGKFDWEHVGGRMASRLFVEVREKRGLVYTVSAGQSSNRQMGAMNVYAGTTPGQARECLKVIVDELRKLEQDGITDDE